MREDERREEERRGESIVEKRGEERRRGEEEEEEEFRIGNMTRQTQNGGGRTCVLAGVDELAVAVHLAVHQQACEEVGLRCEV